MKRFIAEHIDAASCDDRAFTECMRAQAVKRHDELPCSKYMVYRQCGSHVQCEMAVGSLEEADFVIEGLAAASDACWVEKCIGGEWVTVRSSKVAHP